MVSYIASIFWIFFVTGQHVPDPDGIHSTASFYSDKSIISPNEVQGSLKKDTVKIGLIIEKKDELGLMAIRGMEMAVDEANRRRANESSLFKIIVKDCEGPWGMTSKQVASLIYDDEVRVVMTSLDGRNAHLAEQVTTKTHISVVSTRATEVTLTQAFSPWYFRCVPSDKQQARLLFEEVFINNGHKKVGIIKSENYEDQFAADEFIKYINAQGLPSANITTIQYQKNDFNADLKAFEEQKIEAIVIFRGRSNSVDMIDQIRRKGIKTAIYTDLSFTSSLWEWENLKFISPASWYDNNGDIFKKQYESRYSTEPGLAAAYAFDGMNLVIKAISVAGLDRETIKVELARTIYSDGITGCIKFDENGNREEFPVIMEIRNGKPEPVK